MPETWSPCSVARRIPLRVRALICCSLRSRSWRCKAASRLSALRLGAGSGAASASAYLSRSSRLATGLRSAVRRAMGTHQSGYSSPAHRALLILMYTCQYWRSHSNVNCRSTVFPATEVVFADFVAAGAAVPAFAPPDTVLATHTHGCGNSAVVSFVCLDASSDLIECHAVRCVHFRTMRCQFCWQPNGITSEEREEHRKHACETRHLFRGPDVRYLLARFSTAVAAIVRGAASTI